MTNSDVPCKKMHLWGIGWVDLQAESPGECSAGIGIERAESSSGLLGRYLGLGRPSMCSIEGGGIDRGGLQLEQPGITFPARLEVIVAVGAELGACGAGLVARAFALPGLT